MPAEEQLVVEGEDGVAGTLTDLGALQDPFGTR